MMREYDLVDRAQVPGGVELQLLRSGEDFAIVFGRNELMSSDMFASEQALATLTCERIAAQKAPQVLIGGYGMGFTLRAALAALGKDASVIVAELVPQILVWARGPMHRLTDGCLDDARVTLVIDDVGLLIHSAASGYDAILLDVDNGPEGLTRRRNDILYSPAGLQASRKALRSGGVLAVWSADGDGDFTQRLEQAGFDVSEVKVNAFPADADQASDEPCVNHHIWFARKR
ncbi:spermidine synthase [Novosphingobium sp. SG751A]|nr:spermidine synthase [Novosphingobium sp. SG751A]